MDRLKLNIVISAAVLLAVCIFVVLTLQQNNEETSGFDEVGLSAQLQRDTEPFTQEHLEEAKAIFADYGQAMKEIFNQHGWEVQLIWRDVEGIPGTYKRYTAHIDGCHETSIGIEFLHEPNSRRVIIAQGGQIPNADYRYQAFNIDLWSDLLYTFSGGQILRGEVESFLSDEYELLRFDEVERGWPYVLFRPTSDYDKEKIKVGQLYGIQYRLTIYGESLYVEIFHLGGL